MTESRREKASSQESMPPESTLPVEHLFPRLFASEIARLRSIGRERLLADGEVLWDEGSWDVPFFVILEGTILILAGPPERIVVAHEAGGFTGDVDMLSHRQSVVYARASGATKLIEIERSRLRSLVQTDVALGEVFLRAFILRRAALIESRQGNVVLIGSGSTGESLRLQEFLTRNNRPYVYFDVDHDDAVCELFEHFHLSLEEVPIAICQGVHVLRKPTIEELAECLALNCIDETGVYDLVVVGAGPAGLAATVYGASEGLRVLAIEAHAPGGQAGQSSRIENYLGFPMGITGNELAARAFTQAEKFGASIAVARTGARLECAESPYRIRMASGDGVTTRAVVIATGVEYRRPRCSEMTRFEGLGVYYAATALERQVCKDEEVIVVGGGNSAGQAAVFFAGTARQVHVLVRGPSLAASMSNYLIRRIEEATNISLRTRTEIVAVKGAAHLESVTWYDEARDQDTTMPIRHVFLMTGADPNTAWLDGCVALDDKGFVKTGVDLSAEDLQLAKWPLSRPPFHFETSLPGVFAVGDVRASSTKRVAAAVGEGSACLQLVHRFLAEQARSAPVS
jgi:thioredoxin reductase (NADPH)